MSYEASNNTGDFSRKNVFHEFFRILLIGLTCNIRLKFPRTLIFITIIISFYYFLYVEPS